MVFAANCIHGKGKWEHGVQNIYVINATKKEIQLEYSIPTEPPKYRAEKDFIKIVFVGKLGPSEGVWLHPPLGKKISKLIWIFTQTPDDKNEPLNVRYVYSAGHHFAHLNPKSSATREIRIHPKSNRGKNQENPGLEQTIPKKTGKWGGIWPAVKHTEFAKKTDGILSLLNAGKQKELYDIFNSMLVLSIRPSYSSMFEKPAGGWRRFLWHLLMHQRILKTFPNMTERIRVWFDDTEDVWVGLMREKILKKFLNIRKEALEWFSNLPPSLW